MDDEKRAISFYANVTIGGRITIPYEIREELGMKVGDRVFITRIEKVSARNKGV